MEKIIVIGIGKLGLCFALQLEQAGYDVLGIDVNDGYVKSVNNRTLRSPEPGVEVALQSAVNFRAARGMEEVLAFDASLIFIAVATPTVQTGGYDHSVIDNLLDSLFDMPLPSSRKDLIIVCTTLPGYCDSKAGEAQKRNYVLSYHPEFIAQGSIMHDLQHPDQIIIGEGDSEAGDRITGVLEKINVTQPSIFRMNRLSAEIAKLATNCFLTMKISFANAIGELAQITGADTGKILTAVGSDSRIGEKFLQFGFGYGGPCFPRDNRALNFFAKQNGYEFLQADATDRINKNHLRFQLEQMLRQNPEEEPIHFNSVTYKPGTNIIEESQQLALAVMLAQEGRRVVIHERPGVIEQVREQYGQLFEYVVEELTADIRG